MRKRLSLLIILILIIILNSCGLINQPSDKLQIVTTIFPQYDFTRQVVGDLADVKMLLLPGQDTHTYDPSTNDIISIKKADLFIYTGKTMEVWAQTIIDSLPKSVQILDVSKGIDLSIIDEEQGEEHDQHNDHEQHYDPHIWTNPLNAKKIVENIRDKMVEIDPGHHEQYWENAANYLNELDKLDKDFLEVVNNKVRDTLYFAAPFAFYYFVQRYDIHFRSIYRTCSTETDPSIDDIILFTKEINRLKIPVIYTKELLTNTLATKIAKDTGAEEVLLHSAHNVSSGDFNNGITYLDIMRNNIRALMRGLQ